MVKDNRFDIRKPPIPTKTSPNSWLDQWPRQRRSSLVSLFYRAARNGCTAPGTVIAKVERELTHQLHESHDQIRRAHLRTELWFLRDQYSEALLFAQAILHIQGGGE